MLRFSRRHIPRALVECENPCVTARRNDDTLSSAVAARIESITGRREQEQGLLPGDGSPHLLSADSSPCRKAALTLGPTLRRFNRYREAVPYARAANDVSKRLGTTENKKDKRARADCLTRLPVQADELCKALGLPAGTIKDEDLRDEESGFRAVMYRDESSGQLILVARDTQPTSLVDWQTNTRNGDGRDSDQYAQMRRLSRRLSAAGVDFNVAGYSKGGGLAQEAALVNPNAQAFVFNSAGLHENSIARTGATDFSSLESRCHAFSSEAEFLTYMNETTDPTQQLENLRFLRRELEGENRWLVDPMEIDHRNPAQPDGGRDGRFADDLEEYFAELDETIQGFERDYAAGRSIRSFPPVRAGISEVVPDSMSRVGWAAGARNPGPNLGKLAQHLMPNVLNPMERQLEADRTTLQDFLAECP